MKRIQLIGLVLVIIALPLQAADNSKKYKGPKTQAEYERLEKDRQERAQQALAREARKEQAAEKAAAPISLEEEETEKERQMREAQHKEKKEKEVKAKGRELPSLQHLILQDPQARERIAQQIYTTFME